MLTAWSDFFSQAGAATTALPVLLAPLLLLLAPLPLLLAALSLLLRSLYAQGRGAAGPLVTQAAQAAQAAADAAERRIYRRCLWALGLSGAALLPALLLTLQTSDPVHLVIGEWFAVGSLRVGLSLYFDGADLGCAVAVLGMSGLTLVFAAAYLHRDPGFHRAMAGLCLLPAGMLWLLLAGNAVLCFVGWELAGLASWLLIGYVHQNRRAADAALLALVTNRVGDAGFLLSIGLCYLWFGNAEWAELLHVPISESLKLRLLLFGFVIAALAKSGQWPFSFWVGRALEGPTPTSALFYAAVMIHAGVLLLLRLTPLLDQAPDIRALLVVFGLLTLLHAGSTAWLAGDAKTRIAYAGLAQIGLMLIALGWGGASAAPAVRVYLLAHLFWRGRQMLLAPSALIYRHPQAATPEWCTAWLMRLPDGFKTLLGTALLRRGWLEALAQRLLVRPTQALAQDAARLDSQVIDRLLGVPRLRPGGPLRITGHGLAGHLLMALATALAWLEQHLVLQAGGGRIDQALRRVGSALLRIEALLEEPRYLLLMIMATLVVIL